MLDLDLPWSRRSMLHASLLAFAGTASLHPRRARAAALPATVTAGQLPPDGRLGPLKDLDGYFPWTPPKSLAEWTARAEEVRRQLQVACGLWPMPGRPPIEAVIHGKVERDGYTVERVYFESHPGLYVTGSLYRPTGRSGKRPAILSPHGHWKEGRFYAHTDELFEQEMTSGAEMFPSGRYPLQARCVHLARMGCVVFLYDMLDYADSKLFPPGLIHGFAKQRPEMSQPDQWGMFSAQSELRLLSPVGLQTWNSIRALDWFTTLPDVDPDRIGVTGASGGGTQTFLLGALDPRPAALFPAVMVSTSMQGGCTCENTSYLRVNTGNIEIMALSAPRPVGMTGADDWTVEIETKGFPELQQLYSLLGVEGQVRAKYLKFPHNYNAPSRRLMYEFFQQTLGLDGESLDEQDFVPLTTAEATVWSAEHPAPPATEQTELAILRGFAHEFDQQFASLRPVDSVHLEQYRDVIGSGWHAIIGRRLEQIGTATLETVTESDVDGYRTFAGFSKAPSAGEACPTVILLPASWNGALTIWLTPTGKAGLLTSTGSLQPAIKRLLAANQAVAGLDLLYQGEFLADGQPLTETRRVNNPREFLGYTTGYNHPLFAQRVHDVLTLIAAAQQYRTPPTSISLVGIGDTGPIAAVAAVQAGSAVARLAVDQVDFRFASLTEIRDPRLLPGAVRYGDLPGVLALRAPQPLLLGATAGGIPRVVVDAYRSATRLGQIALAKTANFSDEAASFVL
jgi:dienelactone hydrolase